MSSNFLGIPSGSRFSVHIKMGNETGGPVQVKNWRPKTMKKSREKRERKEENLKYNGGLAQ